MILYVRVIIFTHASYTTFPAVGLTNENVKQRRRPLMVTASAAVRNAAYSRYPHLLGQKRKTSNHCKRALARRRARRRPEMKYRSF
jgi:hypothetical protein